MKKLLIISNSEIMTQALMESLSPRFKIYSCQDDPVRSINKLRPHILIISLSLWNTTGIEVLKQVRYRPPAILATTNIANDDICMQAAAVGIGELIRIPAKRSFIIERLDRLIAKKYKPWYKKGIFKLFFRRAETPVK